MGGIIVGWSSDFINCFCFCSTYKNPTITRKLNDRFIFRLDLFLVARSHTNHHVDVILEWRWTARRFHSYVVDTVSIKGKKEKEEK